MDIIKKLAEELNLKADQVERTVALIDEGNTIPFIARYRKEVTGSLDDEVLRKLEAQNPVYVKSMADNLCNFLDELFGTDRMPLCKEYLRRLERSA